MLLQESGNNERSLRATDIGRLNKHDKETKTCQKDATI